MKMPDDLRFLAQLIKMPLLKNFGTTAALKSVLPKLITNANPDVERITQSGRSHA